MKNDIKTKISTEMFIFTCTIFHKDNCFQILWNQFDNKSLHVQILQIAGFPTIVALQAWLKGQNILWISCIKNKTSDVFCMHLCFIYKLT